MWKPLEFEGMEKQMRNNFSRIRTKREMLLAKKVDHLEGKLEAEGLAWNGVGSMVLLLHGSNEVGIGPISDSWLSPVAVDLTRGLLDEGRFEAFELCDESSILETVLSRLIFQLLEQNPAVVRKAADWYQIESAMSHQEDNKLKGLCEALLKIIDVQEHHVFIILNRPELSKEDSPYDYLEIMLNLAKGTEKLKVMLVERAELWDVESDRRRVSARGN
ncbi:hypothetical protein SLS62_006369 [Diatrype stigma]|uniref:Uncharacterized protein n=1 Tax=Diatrype stigma TaxID=117547 RepID=A0AAN9UPY5_9PEZI